MEYQEIIDRRRALVIEPYKSLADVGFDGPWVTPYQITSKSAEGPVFVACTGWMNPRSLKIGRRCKLRDTCPASGSTPIDAALALRGLNRKNIYVTQTFHLIPATRSERISPAAVRRSFDEVTFFELQGSQVVALGDVAADECKRRDLPHVAVCHPSRRGYSNEQNAAEIADAIRALGF